MTDPIGVLWEPATIRLRCAAVARAVDEGRSGWFTLDRSRLPALAQEVAALMPSAGADRAGRPAGCWAAFAAAGADGRAEFERRLAGRAPDDAARARLDFAVLAALLGAEPGAAWRYREQAGAIATIALPVQRQRRDDLLALLDQASGAAPAVEAAESLPEGPATPSADAAAGPGAGAVEAAPHPAGAVHAGAAGLALATWHAFNQGVFSSDGSDPLRADAVVLKRLDAAALRAVFQAGPSNPLAGLEARAELLCRLGQRLEEQAAAQGGAARPSRLLDALTGDGTEGRAGIGGAEPAANGVRTVDAAALLRTIVGGWAAIWPGGSRVLGLPAGDVWPHAWAGADGSRGRDPATSGWVPLHRPGQWLLWSLVGPLAAAGVRVTGLEAMPALPDASHGGLLLDRGVIVARDTRDLERRWKPSDPLVAEWRALTVTLFDELAAQVQAQLGPQAARVLPADLALPPRRADAPAVQVDGDGSLL